MQMNENGLSTPVPPPLPERNAKADRETFRVHPVLIVVIFLMMGLIGLLEYPSARDQSGDEMMWIPLVAVKVFVLVAMTLVAAWVAWGVSRSRRAVNITVVIVLLLFVSTAFQDVIDKVERDRETDAALQDMKRDANEMRRRALENLDQGG